FALVIAFSAIAGASAVPAKSPANLIFPLVATSASPTPAFTAVVTNAVVASFVLLSFVACVTAVAPVGKLGVPVNMGESFGASPLRSWSPVFVPDKVVIAVFANIELVIAPGAIEVAFPTDVTGPVRFALVV